MRKILFSLFLCIACTMQAQEILVGDMNDDNQLSMGDVSTLVNTILGKTPARTVKACSCDPLTADNSAIVGTWRTMTGTEITFEADGSCSLGEGYTYEYRPMQGCILINDETNKIVKIYNLYRADSTYLVLGEVGGTKGFEYYYSSSVFVSSITLSNTEVTLNTGKTFQLSATITPSTASGVTLVWASSDPSVATVSNTGLVTATDKEGTATITATIAGTTLVASTEVTVSSKPAHEYVDLGLPSGTLWATCNIGAENPEDYGDYFAWGETKGYNSGKTIFDWEYYKWCSNKDWTGMTKYTYPDNQTDGIWYSGSTFIGDNKTELDPEDDAAYVNWGSEWRMPTRAQQDELRNTSYTTWTWTTMNGKNGYKVSKKSDSSVYIFLPAAGCRYDSSLNSAGSNGYYWSRSLDTSYSYFAYYLYFHSGNFDWNDYNRYYGRSVRPVFAK